MITPDYVRKMAEYARWMNDGLLASCDLLSDGQRKQDRGAFFKSIHGTLNHLLWGDQIWMHRFSGSPAPVAKDIPSSVSQYQSYEELKHARREFDQVITGWADALDASDLEGELSWYSGAAGRDVTRPRALLITHMFNHQTHHRGQVHCMLTGFGVATPTTDMPFMPLAS